MPVDAVGRFFHRPTARFGGGYRQCKHPGRRGVAFPRQRPVVERAMNVSFERTPSARFDERSGG
jgi:hypothetical protein